MSSQERRPKIPFLKKMWSGGRWDSRRQTDALAPHATYKQRQWMERLPSSNYGRKEGTKGDGLCWSPLACLYERQRTVFGIEVQILEIGVQVCSWSECGNDESIGHLFKIVQQSGKRLCYGDIHYTMAFIIEPTDQLATKEELLLMWWHCLYDWAEGASYKRAFGEVDAMTCDQLPCQGTPSLPCNQQSPELSNDTEFYTSSCLDKEALSIALQQIHHCSFGSKAHVSTSYPKRF